MENYSAQNMNQSTTERKYALSYVKDYQSTQAVALRKQITNGAKQALEEQYWEILEKAVQAKPKTKTRVVTTAI